MCKHGKTKPTNATKEVAGLNFDYRTKECQECGAVLWSQRTEEKFHAWLGQQKREHAGKFTIQKVKISAALVDFAKEIAAKNHSDESSVYQACLAIYFVLGSEKKGLLRKLDKLKPVQGISEIKKFRVNPNIFVKVEASANLFDKHLNEVASWVIERVLTGAKTGTARVELDLVLAA